jgi:ankyrin repeat protein
MAIHHFIVLLDMAEKRYVSRTRIGTGSLDNNNHRTTTSRARAPPTCADDCCFCIQAVEYLVKQEGIFVGSTTKDDEALTPLHLAARYGHHRAVTLLVQLGADINASSLRGTTALQEASQHGEHQTVQCLRRLRNNSGTRVSYAYPTDPFSSTTSPAESGCAIC